MGWICTDWAIDWTAVAAMIALGIWLADLLRKRSERKAAARVLAHLMLIELGNLRAYLLGMSVDLRANRSTEAQAELDARISMQAEFRRQLLGYQDNLQSETLRRLSERVDVLPSFFATSLALAFSELNAVIHLSRLVGESPHDGMHAESMPDLRAAIGDAVIAIEDAEKDAAALARVSRFDAWRRRMRAR